MDDLKSNTVIRKPRLALKSFLLSVLATIGFVVVVFMTFSGYDKLYFLYFPVVFVLAWIYFYFMLRVWNSGILKYYLGISLFIACYFVFQLGLFDVDIKLRNLFKNNNLPRQYENYERLDTNPIAFGDYQISLLVNSKYNDKLFHLINENGDLVVYKIEDLSVSFGDIPKFKHVFFKYDHHADLIDSCVYMQEGYYSPNFFEGYFFDTKRELYNTWVLDGDSISKKVNVLNENFDWSEKKIYEQMNSVVKNATYYFAVFDNYYKLNDKDVKYTKYYFLEGNTWNILYLPSTINVDYDTYFETKGRIVYDIFSVKDKKYRYDYILKESPTNLSYEYFQKQKLFRNRYSIQAMQSTPYDTWEGDLYAKLWMGKDTLRFKNKFYMSDLSIVSKFKIKGESIGNLQFEDLENFQNYVIYTDPRWEYSLLAVGKKKIYVIKKKS